MSNNDAVIVCFLMFVVFVLGVCVVTDSPTYNQCQSAEAIIERCEATLPRDQHCILIAVPEGQDDE